MMLMLELLKGVCLFLGIAYGFTCFGRLFKGQPVSQGQTFIMAAGVAGFIALQWL